MKSSGQLPCFTNISADPSSRSTDNDSDCSQSCSSGGGGGGGGVGRTGSGDRITTCSKHKLNSDSRVDHSDEREGLRNTRAANLKRTLQSPLQLNNLNHHHHHQHHQHDDLDVIDLDPDTDTTVTSTTGACSAATSEMTSKRMRIPSDRSETTTTSCIVIDADDEETVDYQKFTEVSEDSEDCQKRGNSSDRFLDMVYYVRSHK